MICAAIGAATALPSPPCSMYTQTAICGFSIGAKAMNAEWSWPAFCAVPVFPHIVMRGSLMFFAVPPVTQARMPAITSSYASGDASVVCGVMYVSGSAPAVE